MKPSSYFSASLCLLILAASLFFFRIGQHSLWSDELITAEKMVSHSHSDIWNEPFYAGNAPGYMVPYYSALKIWCGFFGTSEAGLRSFSAINALLALFLILFFGPKHLGLGNSGALIAGATFTFSPMMLWYAQEARYYGFLQPLALAVCVCYSQYWKTNRRTWLLIWTVISSFAIMAHAYMIFGIVALSFYGLWLLRQNHWKQTTGFIVHHGIVALIFLLIMARGLFSDYDRISTTEHVAYTLFTDDLMPWKVLSNFLCGVYEHGSVMLASILLLAATIALVLHGRNVIQKSTHEIDGALWMAASLGGCMLMIAISWFYPIMVEGKRYVMVFFAPFCVCLGRALIDLPMPRINACVFLGVMAINSAMVDLNYFTQPQKQNWRMAGAVIEKNAKPGDVWIHQTTARRFASSYYAPQASDRVMDVTWESTVLLDRIPQQISNAKRVWMVKTGSIVDAYDARLREAGFQCTIKKKLLSGTHFPTQVLLYEHTPL